MAPSAPQDPRTGRRYSLYTEMNRHENCEYSHDTLVRIRRRGGCPPAGWRRIAKCRAFGTDSQTQEVPMNQGKKRKSGLRRVAGPVTDAASDVAKSVKRSGSAVGRKAGGVLRSIGEVVVEGAEVVTKAGAKAVSAVKETLSPTEPKSGRGGARPKAKAKVKAKSASSSPRDRSASRSGGPGAKAKSGSAKAKSPPTKSASAGGSRAKTSRPRKSS